MDTGPRPLRVLIVEDNADAAAMLALVLQIEGHDVRTAADGPAALAAVRVEPPDLVLCDIGLPRMDGFAVAREIRATPGMGKVTLVALTGYGRDEDRDLSRAAGFDYHFVKPLDPAALEELLRDLAPGGPAAT